MLTTRFIKLWTDGFTDKQRNGYRARITVRFAKSFTDRFINRQMFRDKRFDRQTGVQKDSFTKRMIIQDIQKRTITQDMQKRMITQDIQKRSPRTYQKE